MSTVMKVTKGDDTNKPAPDEVILSHPGEESSTERKPTTVIMGDTLRIDY